VFSLITLQIVEKSGFPLSLIRVFTQMGCAMA